MQDNEKESELRPILDWSQRKGNAYYRFRRLIAYLLLSLVCDCLFVVLLKPFSQVYLRSSGLQPGYFAGRCDPTSTRTERRLECTFPDRLHCEQSFAQVAQQLFSFRATFCILSNFSSFLAILRYWNSLKCLNWPFLNTSMFQQTIYEFPVKKEPDPPPWGRSWAQNACSRVAKSMAFKRKLKWRRSLSQVHEEGHSTISLAHSNNNNNNNNNNHTLYLKRVARNSYRNQ